MGLKEKLMWIVVKVQDVVAVARRFEASPAEAMRELVVHTRDALAQTLEQVMQAEIDLFLGEDSEGGNKRNGYRSRGFGIKGVGTLRVRVPRDRAGRFESNVVPAKRRYDEATEKDVALLNLAGLSTRMLSHVSGRILGVKVSPQEVSNSLHRFVPAAKQFLNRPLGGRAFVYLYIDGTNFHVRRTTVDKEPTLVVIGVDKTWHKSLLAMVSGDKESRRSWEMVFAELKERGLDAQAVELGVMGGLPGLAEAFAEAFPRARVSRCWVHKARNVLPMVPHRYQAEFKNNWDAVQYAENGEAARGSFKVLKARWTPVCGDAVAKMEYPLHEPRLAETL